MPRKVITEELKQEIIKYYLSQPMTMKQVEDKYELSHPTITKILKDVPKYTKAKLNNPNMKEHFFKEINNEASAYFLGLLISDGNVFKDGTGRQASISITFMDAPAAIALQLSHSLQGLPSTGCSQLTALAISLAIVVLPVPLVPQNKYACPILSCLI